MESTTRQHIKLNIIARRSATDRKSHHRGVASVARVNGNVRLLDAARVAYHGEEASIIEIDRNLRMLTK